jgi:hypothetical protein
VTEPLQAQFEPTPAWKEAHDRLKQAIQDLEKVHGGKILAIEVMDEGLLLHCEFKPDQIEQFEIASGFKARN